MSRLIFFFVATLLGWGCFATPTQSQGLFDEEGLSERERASLEQRRAALESLSEGIPLLLLLLQYEEFQKGNCSGLGEIDTKAKEGIAKYQFILADLYHQGLCVTKNDERAVDWLKKSAKQGYARAQHDLGVYYKSGLGIPANPRQAAYWFLKAAENGVAASQHTLATMYEAGAGILQDYSEARRWYEEAVKQGYSQSTLHLTRMYLKGSGVEVNPKKAFDWALIGARAGYKQSQNLVAEFYLKGVGTQPNLIEAHKWANLASSSGLAALANLSASVRAEAEKKMTPSQITSAQRLAKQWKPQKKEQPLRPSKRKALKLPDLSDNVADHLSAEAAKVKLRELGVPISKDVFFLAVEQDNLGIFKLFHRAGAALETKTSMGVTPLYWAVDYGSYKVYRYLMQNETNINVQTSASGMTPLVMAIVHDRWDMVDELLDAGADGSQKFGIGGKSGLSESPLVYAMMASKPELVRRLLKRGASVKEKYLYGNTPLHNAARDGKTDIAKILLEAGADVNAANQFGQTPMLEGLSDEKPIGTQMLKLLLSAGSSSTQSAGGLTPLLFTTLKGNSGAIKLLVGHGADPHERYRLTANQIPINIADRLLRGVLMNGGTPLMVAAASGHVDVSKLLVQLGADRKTTIPTEKGALTAAGLARASGHTYLAKALETGAW